MADTFIKKFTPCANGIVYVFIIIIIIIITIIIIVLFGLRLGMLFEEFTVVRL